MKLSLKVCECVRGARIDAFCARGHVIGFIDESYSSKMCSRTGCAEGVCDDKWLVVPARPELEPRQRRRVMRAVVRCDLCCTIFELDWNAARNIWLNAIEWRAARPAGRR